MYLTFGPEDDRLLGSRQTRVYALKDNVRYLAATKPWTRKGGGSGGVRDSDRVGG